MRSSALRLRGHGTRGASFIFFALVAFPILVLALAMVGDVARSIVAQRQVTNAAQAAALAGAWQVRQGTTTIDQCAAAFAAVDTYNSAVAVGMMQAARPAPIAAGASSATGPCSPPVGWSAPDYTDGYLNFEFSPENAPNSLAVTAGWEMDVLIGGFFGLDLTYTGTPVTAVASVCDPRDPSGVTEGYCVRPQ